MKLGWRKCSICKTNFDWWYELRMDITLPTKQIKVVCELCRSEEE